MSPEEKLAALGLILPPVPTPVANYVPFRFAGNLLFLSGQGPKHPDGSYGVGRLGLGTTIEQAYADARLTGLQLLAELENSEQVTCHHQTQALNVHRVEDRLGIR